MQMCRAHAPDPVKRSLVTAVARHAANSAMATAHDNLELKPFLLLAKTAKGAAAAALVKQVLDHPGVNVFGELLDMPNMQAVSEQCLPTECARGCSVALTRVRSCRECAQLAGTSSSGSLELLRVFAYGTWSDYKARASELPALTEAQVTKLKKLTVVALAAQGKLLAYDVLLRELELGGVRELEDLLIECIYAGLLQGRLDQQAGHLEVFSCAGRDVHPDEIPGMATTLLEWQAGAATLMAEVSEQLGSFKQQQEEARKAQTELDEKVEAVRTTLRDHQGSADGLGSHSIDGDARMDFDDDKMRKSGRMKSRHIGPGGKHGARM